MTATLIQERRIAEVRRVLGDMGAEWGAPGAGINGFILNVPGTAIPNKNGDVLSQAETHIGTTLKDRLGYDVKVKVTVYQAKGNGQYRIEFTVDAAEKALVDNAAIPTGGIDLAQSNLDMQIKRDGAGVPLPVSQQNLDNIRIDGLVPVILDIKPASSVPAVMQ